MSTAGAVTLDGWLDASTEPFAGSLDASTQVATAQPTGPEAELLHRLTEADLIAPGVRCAEFEAASVTVVIPVRNDHSFIETVRAVTSALDSTAAVAEIIVVDDASEPPIETWWDTDTLVGAESGRPAIPMRLIRTETNLGPGGARDLGWRAAQSAFVAFLDSDVTPDPGWLESLAGWTAQPGVALVAPRVASRPGDGLLDRYEAERSPLDMGPHPAEVGIGHRRAYVPSAAWMIRRDTLEALGGFDEGLRTGEDVDLVWRILTTGGRVRYEPASRVQHRVRSTWSEFARQRFGYGRSAAGLAERHGAAVAHAAGPLVGLTAWGAWLVSAPLGALFTTALVARNSWQLAGLLGGPDRGTDLVSLVEAGKIAGRGQLVLGRALVGAARRVWLPLLLPAVATRRGRYLLALVVVGEPTTEWLGSRMGRDEVTRGPDERVGAERAVISREPAGRGARGRSAGGWGADGRGADGWGADGRGADGWGADGRGAGEWGADGWGAGGRGAAGRGVVDTEPSGDGSGPTKRLGLSSWLALRALDDGAYCAGVWSGLLESRSWGAAKSVLAARTRDTRP